MKKQQGEEVKRRRREKEADEEKGESGKQKMTQVTIPVINSCLHVPIGNGVDSREIKET